MFENINENQWAWYQVQIFEDDEERLELLREIAEHNAMFSNPEGVQQVREAREHTYDVPDKDFSNVVKEMFGRDLPDMDKDKVDVSEVLKKRNSELLDPYLNMDLDDIKFTPM